MLPGSAALFELAFLPEQEWCHHENRPLQTTIRLYFQEIKAVAVFISSGRPVACFNQRFNKKLIRG
jgi:hypothetical protein